ncbi:MAG: Slp family lipoprotein [Deltaproteobacteria bacterium]|nr:Slp family lipoprotein [Deltaproteobacteria bacterium]
MRTLIVVLMTFIIAGCSVISKETRKQVDENITLDMVQSNPDRYIGRKVLWGGIILGTDNLAQYSEVEVLETELAYDKSPEDGNSRGRFIIRSKKFLDAKVYSENKRITVAGTIEGTQSRKIGQMEYQFPVINPIEMRLFEEPKYTDYQPYMYGYPYSYGPYSPYYPYGPYSPYGPTFPYGPYPYRYPYYPFP